MSGSNTKRPAGSPRRTWGPGLSYATKFVSGQNKDIGLLFFVFYYIYVYKCMCNKYLANKKYCIYAYIIKCLYLYTFGYILLHICLNCKYILIYRQNTLSPVTHYDTETTESSKYYIF